MSDWMPALGGVPDELFVRAVERAALLIADFAELAGKWARRALTHWGIVPVSERTVSQRSAGDLPCALEHLMMEFPGEDALVDQVLFLTRREGQEEP